MNWFTITGENPTIELTRKVSSWVKYALIVELKTVLVNRYLNNLEVGFGTESLRLL